jgi:hypothetical protein
MHPLRAAEAYLKTGMTFAHLDKLARSLSDTAWAKRMAAAKTKLLRACKIESPFSIFPARLATMIQNLRASKPAASGRHGCRFAASRSSSQRAERNIAQPPLPSVFRIILHWEQKPISASFSD